MSAMLAKVSSIFDRALSPPLLMDFSSVRLMDRAARFPQLRQCLKRKRKRRREREKKEKEQLGEDDACLPCSHLTFFNP